MPYEPPIVARKFHAVLLNSSVLRTAWLAFSPLPLPVMIVRYTSCVENVLSVVSDTNFPSPVVIVRYTSFVENGLVKVLGNNCMEVFASP